jgi:hypothetical membrane protein
MQSGKHRLLGRLAMLGPIAFTAAWLIAGVAEDEYFVRREDISALAAIDAQYPWIMITGFLLLALGCVALALGLASAIAGWSARIGSLLLLIAGLGLAVAGLARNDCSSELQACAARVEAGIVSWHHVLHDNVSLLIFLSLVAAPLVLARAFHRTDGWRDLRLYSMATGLLTLVLLILYVTASGRSEIGLVERIFVSVPFLWIGVLGFRLARLSRPRP